MAGVAVYAGSFDPITRGHLDIIARACAVFSEVVVAVGHNPAKRYLLDVDTRVELVRDATAELAVRVAPFDGLLVDAVSRFGGDVILRGLRALGDFETEFRYALANRDLTGVETVFLVADPRYVFVSSSLVKEIAAHGGDVSAYVPEGVLPPLHAALGHP